MVPRNEGWGPMRNRHPEPPCYAPELKIHHLTELLVTRLSDGKQHTWLIFLVSYILKRKDTCSGPNWSIDPHKGPLNRNNSSVENNRLLSSRVILNLSIGKTNIVTSPKDPVHQQQILYHCKGWCLSCREQLCGLYRCVQSTIWRNGWIIWII